MSWTDSILSSTVGLVFRGVTGNVDPWTLSQNKDDASAGILKASGPNADPALVAVAQAQANSDIDSNLMEEDAHPSQAGVRLPVLGVVGSADFLKKLEHGVYVALAVGGIVGVLYFAVKYKQTLGRFLK